jgi:hypothetical protein
MRRLCSVVGRYPMRKRLRHVHTGHPVPPPQGSVPGNDCNDRCIPDSAWPLQGKSELITSRHYGQAWSLLDSFEWWKSLSWNTVRRPNPVLRSDKPGAIGRGRHQLVCDRTCCSSGYKSMCAKATAVPACWAGGRRARVREAVLVAAFGELIDPDRWRYRVHTLIATFRAPFLCRAVRTGDPIDDELIRHSIRVTLAARAGLLSADRSFPDQ